ncbi:biotin-dependent carboxyltransferase family protein [Aquimarina sp. SS2-1]|uniref:5-oxoprolinase subunit C family protein n=1 Tax=Aquimarina besae TaxID=3342247 RepID=UPI0036716F91
MRGAVEIISPGLYTSIQDQGRFGFSKYGIPRSGAMDHDSYFLANSILGNNHDCAVIEWTMIPPVLKFHEDTVITITGAVCIPFLNDDTYKMYSQLRVKKGDVLKLKNVQKGVYGFVGIKSGFQSDLILNSRSQYKMITHSDKLQKSDLIPYHVSSDFSTSNSVINPSFLWMTSNQIYAFPGPEFDLLSSNQKKFLFSKEFTVSTTRNRMAIPLDEPLENKLDSMLTSPVLPGTVQLTPSGQLIVLMRDCQTTGGYPRVLQLSEKAINCIAQKKAGEKIKFVLNSL